MSNWNWDAGMFMTPAIAIACGFLLGWNRERKGRAAGLRTQILVTLGSAVLVMGGESTLSPELLR